MDICACGSNKDYSICCGAFISGEKTPSTPEELMRSRYTAYTQANIDYIARTMKSPAADDFNTETALAWIQRVEWIGLEVRSTATEGTKGYVEFIARFKQNNQPHILHELSEFHLENGRWYYTDGSDPRTEDAPIKIPKVHRNDPCLCGSGKKYKKCCGTF